MCRFLQEVGYEDIFNENEINEIKDLYNKAQAELQESFAATEMAEPNLLKLQTNILNQTTVQEQELPVESESLKVALEEKYMLKSHFDIVRSLHLANDDKILVTVSEDCMIKLWHMPEMEQRHSESRGNIEPYLTLRGHTGSLLAASGRGNVLFTAGVEGVIKMWSLPTVSEVNQYGDTFEGKNYCMATWSNEN